MENMGVHWFIVLWMFFCVRPFGFVSVAAQTASSMCNIQECNCTVKAAPWIVINCSLSEGQVVNTKYVHVPETAIEIFINGGREVIFSTTTFKGMPGLNLIRMNGVRRIWMEKKSFYLINSSSLLIQIKNCDELIIKTGAFEQLQSSVTTEIFDVDFISIEPLAFSKLYNSTFKNIKTLKLHERAFEFDNQADNYGHGPAVIIIFDNAAIPRLPRDVFLVSLASVSFRRCNVTRVENDAFKSTEIALIEFIDSNVDTIEEGAFAQRALIHELIITRCNITKIDTGSILASMDNFSLTDSLVVDIQPGAISATTVRTELINNEIFNIYSQGVVVNSWSFILMNKNIIKRVCSRFIVPSDDRVNSALSFVGNEIYDVEEGAFAQLSQFGPQLLKYDDNFFNRSCDCSIDAWLIKISNSTRFSQIIGDTSFCTVSTTVSKCFSLPVGTMNIKNFTEKSCKNFTSCEPYEGKTRIVDTTSRIFVEEFDYSKQTVTILIITTVVVFVIIVVVALFMLILGNRWIKEKIHFRSNNYNNNDLSIEEEGTVVTLDENKQIEMPDELTMDFLQDLKKRLDDPATRQQAEYMIEYLYETFVEEGYEPNNRQDEAHLYEELGNLKLHTPPPPYEEEKDAAAENILKLMEQKVNRQIPAILAGDYSEPTDAAVHLYSELKKSDKCNKKESNSTTDSNETFDSQDYLFDQPGPSTKM
ncbi:unnamed protein product [Phyllotreta striolata]|uniref:Uncharacterized protein n=1 Tax=Phyllotreta striolata TaxID=444603 RepID=A0A9N9TKP8_PHYSR|nr:unnamed protein product [Phyllotreta striolata]